MIGSGYQLTKAFYDEVAQNEAMQIKGVTPAHHSLYTWICELRNRTQLHQPGREVLDLPVRYTMEMSFIGSQHTLSKCIDDLADWEIIEILQRGSNQHKTTKIRLAVAYLQKHCKSDASAQQAAVADMQSQCNLNANAVQTTKTDKTIVTDKTRKPARSSKVDELVQLLAACKFQSDAFKRIWSEWQQFRIEQKKPLTPTSVRQQLKDLSAYPEEQVIAIIEQSIRNGWQGLFPLKEEPGKARTFNGHLLQTSQRTHRPTPQTDIR